LGRAYEEIKPPPKRLKRILASVILWFLGRGFQAAAYVDEYVKDEVRRWEDGTTIVIGVAPCGPYMSIRKQGTRLRFLGNVNTPDADIIIMFNNIEAALLILTGQIGIDRAYAEHRFSIKGDLCSIGMPMVRCLYIVESYLFPNFINKKILKRPPERSSSKFTVYFHTIFGV
jgi:hypothetical protein